MTAKDKAKPIAWRIFRGGRWSYSDAAGKSQEDRAAWQPLYAQTDSPTNCGTGHCSCIECHVEPVAYISVDEDGDVNSMSWKDNLPPGEHDLYTALTNKGQTCADCDRKQSDGWALYCVDCLRDFYQLDPTNEFYWITEDDVQSWELPEGATVFEFVQFVQEKIKEKNVY